MVVTFEYKMYSTQEHQERMFETLEVLRHLYNNSLSERIDAWKYENVHLNYCKQANQLPGLKKESLLTSVYSHVAQDALRRLDKAFANFYRRVNEKKAGKKIKAGFPRFKGIGRYRSFTYPEWGNGVSLRLRDDKEGEAKDAILHLSKIGDIPVRLHRPLQGTPKTATISHKADGWYVSIACVVEPEPLPKTGKGCRH